MNLRDTATPLYEAARALVDELAEFCPTIVVDGRQCMLFGDPGELERINELIGKLREALLDHERMEGT